MMNASYKVKKHQRVKLKIKNTANASIFQKQDVQNSFKYFLTDILFQAN